MEHRGAEWSFGKGICTDRGFDEERHPLCCGGPIVKDDFVFTWLLYWRSPSKGYAQWAEQQWKRHYWELSSFQDRECKNTFKKLTGELSLRDKENTGPV